MTPAPAAGRAGLTAAETLDRDPKAVRVAHVAWLERAYARSLRHGEGSIPYGAVTVGVWLICNGWWGVACEPERATNWLPQRYRMYRNTLSQEALEQELAAAERILFTGGRAIMRRANPIERIAA